MERSKNVLITGVSTGIGFECAKAFAKAGYHVFGSVRKPNDAHELSSEFGDFFTELVFDVTDHMAVDKAAEKVRSIVEAEGLGGLINNAGIATGGPLMELSIDQLRYQYEVNVIGLIKVTQAFLPLLGANKNHTKVPGRIINVSSVAGKVGMPFMGAYAGSKHAVEGMSQSLRRELMLYDIDVIVIGPGAIKTPIWNKGMSAEFKDSAYAKPLEIFTNKFVRGAIKGALEPKDLADRIFQVFEKSSPRTRYAMVAGKLKNSIIPGLLPNRLLDKLLAKALKMR